VLPLTTCSGGPERADDGPGNQTFANKADAERDALSASWR